MHTKTIPIIDIDPERLAHWRIVKFLVDHGFKKFCGQWDEYERAKKMIEEKFDYSKFGISKEQVAISISKYLEV